MSIPEYNVAPYLLRAMEKYFDSLLDVDLPSLILHLYSPLLEVMGLDLRFDEDAAAFYVSLLR